MLAWKLRIAVLWIFVSVVNVSLMIMLMFEAGTIRDLIAGEWLGADARSAGIQVLLAFNLLAPMAMAFLTLALDDVVSRRTNVVVGTLTAVYAVLNLFGLLGGSFGAGVAFSYVVGSLVVLLIVWHAWKWPRRSEVPLPRQERESTLR